ncbi:hypothetical protein [Paenibacillus sp. YN15]|uniref:hypothetical protein n=1 Tax=Paenibacillus sp. YN15 TaxID=1742774 RepID=UPI000DCD5EAB|nr:hypothetical protein [Paenibacillus sp. YN15]RAU96786.1 hypothetical protein DQG13_19700 [Paenibacillus sp. YN15]
MKREVVIAKWSTLKPRERDAWVAEVVFGKKIGRERRIGGSVYEIGHGGIGIELDSYTTDIYAAWAAASGIPGEFILFRLLPDKFVASFGYSVEECPECGEDPFEVTAQGVASSPAEAICLAALIAKLCP